MNHDQTIREYVEAGRTLKEKYEQLRYGTVTRRNILEEKYKPITDPLRDFGKQWRRSSSVASSQTTPETIRTPKTVKGTEKKPDHLMHQYIFDTPPAERDKTFGIRMQDKTPYLANSRVVLRNDGLVEINNETFVVTRGLCELLTLKKPINFTKEDLAIYEHLILTTYAYRHNYDPNASGVKASNGVKYLTIIQPMLIRNRLLKSNLFENSESEMETADDDDGSETEEPPVGSGLGLRKILTKNNNIEYVYYNTLEELLDRFYIVYGEIKSGNNSPHLINELSNILEEFKEM